MSLRTRILLFLFVFALLPLLGAVAINLPLVLDRVELFYRQAFLQNLRADFQDLDTHLASRDEMLRLLAKLPEPGVVLGQDPRVGQAQIARARLKYTEWINRILQDQLDIVEILFLGRDGTPKFWLSRDPENHRWRPTTTPPHLPPEELIQQVLAAKAPVVLLAPVSIDEKATDLSRAVTLQLMAPLGPSEGKETYGAVAMTLDIGGLVRRDERTLWVHDDGRYLNVPGIVQRSGSAFEDFPGLKEKFAARKIVLWEGKDGRTVIWVPLLRTEGDKPLWVGRPVREEPLMALRDALIFRVSAIILALVVVIFLVSTWVAGRMERLGKRVFEGVRKVVEEGEPVKFRWKGSAELRQLGENLSRLSETHARNLAELQDHARALEESNRYKSEFLANVSHELRTPLNSILLLSKLLLKESDGLSREQQEQLRVIHEASADLRMLIDNVLDLSRMEAGRLEPLIEEVELLPLLEEIHDQLAPQFREKGLAFRVRIDEKAPVRIRTDPHKLAQILKNFLSNALKFTDEGEVVVELAPAAEPHAVALSVQDTGIGIPPEKQQAIFEAFQQADGSTRRRFGGTGLGLSISRELAQILCGEIRVRSRPGEGSRFTLLLPANCGEMPAEGAMEEPGAEKATATPPQPVLEAAAPRADLAGAHVLLVESDIGRLLELSRWLEGWHLQVTAAEDEEEVREVLEEDGIQLLLLAEGVVDWCTISVMVKKQGEARPRLIGLGEAGEPAAPCVDAVLPREPEPRQLLSVLQANLRPLEEEKTR